MTLLNTPGDLAQRARGVDVSRMTTKSRFYHERRVYRWWEFDICAFGRRFDHE